MISAALNTLDPRPWPGRRGRKYLYWCWGYVGLRPQVGCLVAGTSLANKYPLKPLDFFQVVFRFVPVVFSTCFSLGEIFNAVIRSIVSLSFITVLSFASDQTVKSARDMSPSLRKENMSKTSSERIPLKNELDYFWEMFGDLIDGNISPRRL
jgi:hypothetical protein